MNPLDKVFWGNTLGDWAIAAGLCLALALGLRLALAVLKSRLGRLAKRTSNHVDDVLVGALGRTHPLTFLAIGLAAGARTLDLSAGAAGVLGHALVALLLIQAAAWAAHAANSWLEHYRSRQLEDDRAVATTVGAISFVVRVVIWAMTLLLVMSNLGVNITAMITGLGIGGIAVALALQNVFSDLFASLSIVFDKPFVIGDFVIIGEFLGAVEHVGLKTTRIRSLSGEQLVFSNSDLLNSRIRNYGRMYERRVSFRLGVAYRTSQDKLERVPGIIRAAIEEQEKTRFDRAHFAKFGEFSLEFEIVYYVLEPDYNLYMDIQEQINLKVREGFQAEGIEFAFPTRTVFLERAAG